MDTDFENRIVAPDYVPEDADLETSLRPRVLTDYIGQEKVKENLRIYIEAARGRGEPSTMCCSTARPASVKQRSRASSPMKWE